MRKEMIVPSYGFLAVTKVPRMGKASEVLGVLSATRLRNTVKDNRTLIPSLAKTKGYQSRL